MSKLTKVFFGISATILICAIATFFVLKHLVVQSFPKTSGTLTIAGLHQAVDVYRDHFGIPHIHAQDEHDLMMATGYVQAQDRLWQMDLMRRAGEGRLAEVLGDSAVVLDKLVVVEPDKLAPVALDRLAPVAVDKLVSVAVGKLAPAVLDRLVPAASDKLAPPPVAVAGALVVVAFASVFDEQQPLQQRHRQIEEGVFLRG